MSIHTNIETACSYVRSLRHPAKKAYATVYLQHSLLRLGPAPHPANLSVMGAQAVRLAIDEILKTGRR